MTDERTSASKSYDLSGDTADFDPKKLQVHAFSLEFRKRMSKVERPRLDSRPIVGRGGPSPMQTALNERWRWPARAVVIGLGALYLWFRDAEPQPVVAALEATKRAPIEMAPGPVARAAVAAESWATSGGPASPPPATPSTAPRATRSDKPSASPAAPASARWKVWAQPR